MTGGSSIAIRELDVHPAVMDDLARVGEALMDGSTPGGERRLKREIPPVGREPDAMSRARIRPMGEADGTLVRQIYGLCGWLLVAPLVLVVACARGQQVTVIVAGQPTTTARTVNRLLTSIRRADPELHDRMLPYVQRRADVANHVLRVAQRLADRR